MNRRRFTRQITGAVGVAAFALPFRTDGATAGRLHPFDRRPQPWQRLDQPILSARTTREDWCKVVMYSPHVLFHEGRFRMWYLGTSTGSRSGDTRMGYAESADGVTWRSHPGNPIFSGAEIPWGDVVQTPCVLFDPEEQIFKLWFVSGRVTGHDDQGRALPWQQRLGYGTSPDGLRWRIHPEPVYPSGRGPYVIKEAPNRYRMWMGSIPEGGAADALFANIYHFTSTDGISWQRDAEPVLRPDGRVTTTVYVSVLKEGGHWYLWHGGHVAGGRFEIFCGRSTDGRNWRWNLDKAAFPAREGRTAFDSRYTSTPRVLSTPDRWLIYYSARDWNTGYVDGGGRARRDGSSPYSHIGVAVIPKDGPRE